MSNNEDELLSTACKEGDLKTVQYLVEDRKVDLYAKTGDFDQIPLHYACE